ncbi:MAG: MauE/DoxX family redox-associated membrane protein [Acidimicrobiia bacterium]
MRLVLAVLLLVMAAGQLSDMGGFADVLDGYRLVPEPLLTPLAWSLAASEVMAGLGLVSSRRWGANLAVVVAVAWSVLAIVTFARDVPVDNCGCFGVHLGQPLRWWVLAQDASFVASALLVRRAIRPPRVGAGGDGARSRDVSALR